LRVFEYRLARTLGRTRQELLDSISNAEYLEQLAMQEFSPLDDHWLQSAIVASEIRNQFAKKKTTIADFLPMMKTKKKTFDARAVEASLLRIVNNGKQGN
jgi:hypothetical protein